MRVGKRAASTGVVSTSAAPIKRSRLSTAAADTASVKGRLPVPQPVNDSEDDDDDDDDGTEVVSDDDVDESDNGVEDEDVTDQSPSSSSTTLAPLGSAIQRRSVAPLSTATLSDFNARLAKTGVVYFSRLPPHTKPTNLRSLLQSYGEIGRIYLTPARSKHTKGKRFSDGWVEFVDKSLAKRLALTLNNTQIGGRKRSRYYDDIWNCLYLKGFKWQHLTEKLAFERREREQRLRHELSEAKKETEDYRRQVERAKIDKRKRERADKRGGGGSSDSGSGDQRFRTFHQRSVLD